MSVLAAAKPKRKRLGEMLIDKGLITAEQLGEGLGYQRVHGGRIGEVLVTLGHLEEEDLTSNLGQQLGLQVATFESIAADPTMLRACSREVLEKYQFVPIQRRGSTVEVGMIDPQDLQSLDGLRFVLQTTRVEARVITQSTFERFLETNFPVETTLRAPSIEDITRNKALDTRVQQAEKVVEQNVHDLEAEAGTHPVARILTWTLTAAIEQRASDIHMEPYEKFFRIRFRIDGKLYTVLKPPANLHAPLVSRTKVLSEMDISERRKPQDGHLAVTYQGETCHFRVSTLPTSYGEKCVIRLLKKEAHLADVSQLGFSRSQFSEIERKVRLSQGLVLVTGPTGSGKTTTLHAMVNMINEPDINIVTVEDPVESTIVGVNHVPIKDSGGTSFSAGLRSILRQDPDVVLVGEMRDKEVSQIAIKAALTGHLVLSTLHTNGVIPTFNRLIDMGVEPYLLASCVKLVVAQRLLRRLCSRCAVQTPISDEVAQEFRLTPEQVETAHARNPAGCDDCMGTGYRGRVGVYEMMAPNEEVREILRTGGTEGELARAAAADGFVTMEEAGIQRALAGLTSFDEVRRVLAEE
ncbi:MAG: Flp pilus assembly complex ATPase component [Proteobacteria bacterium]|nr:Flp pilus assembly complex ATPase component [Pseudomonadota bacterium]MCP4916598.1 Flp pilus assembly complex ATPase component [Pseudomonadota bacterium]